jgi:flavin reductase (DIM6/NTAB) family NADH-FMN oxidoreductase RutF
VVNIMSSWYLESANHCSGPFSADQNEMVLAGLTSLPSEVVKPPRVAEAAVQLECEVQYRNIFRG